MSLFHLQGPSGSPPGTTTGAYQKEGGDSARQPQREGRNKGADEGGAGVLARSVEVPRRPGAKPGEQRDRRAPSGRVPTSGGDTLVPIPLGPSPADGTPSEGDPPTGGEAERVGSECCCCHPPLAPPPTASPAMAWDMARASVPVAVERVPCWGRRYDREQRCGSRPGGPWRGWHSAAPPPGQVSLS